MRGAYRGPDDTILRVLKIQHVLHSFKSLTKSERGQTLMLSVCTLPNALVNIFTYYIYLSCICRRFPSASTFSIKTQRQNNNYRTFVPNV